MLATSGDRQYRQYRHVWKEKTVGDDLVAVVSKQFCSNDGDVRHSWGKILQIIRTRPWPSFSSTYANPRQFRFYKEFQDEIRFFFVTLVHFIYSKGKVPIR